MYENIYSLYENMKAILYTILRDALLNLVNNVATHFALSVPYSHTSFCRYLYIIILCERLE